MFSANENLQLRQHKRRIVGFIEECIPEEALDLGVSVMVMQVSYKAPGCVPLETAIVIVFPDADEPLLPDLPESQGGSYKTKVLKPMSAVTQQDVLEALPPAFPGGLRSMEKLCLQGRDVMLAQITQLFGEEDLEGRRLMALYLQKSLQEYMQRECTPPEWGEPFAPLEGKTTGESDVANIETSAVVSSVDFAEKKNIVLKRAMDNAETSTSPSTSTTENRSQSSSTQAVSLVNTVTKTRQQHSASKQVEQGADSNNSNLLARLAQREHAPGMRQPGCPCCDPDHPSK